MLNVLVETQNEWPVAAEAPISPLRVASVEVTELAGVVVTEEFTGVMYVNAPVEVVVPPSVLVTTTFCEPAVPAGVVAVIDVELATTTFVAAAPPIITLAPLLNSVPVIVMAVPPAVDPEAGLALVIVGEETVVNCTIEPGDQVPPTSVQAA